jgi:hypothetical protein
VPATRVAAGVLVCAATVLSSVPLSGSASAAEKPRTPAGVSAREWSRVLQLAPALKVLRACEAGGNYRANTGNGYFGAYQFSAATWRRVGMTGLPHKARPAVQDTAAARLHDRRGSWADWGSCGRKAARLRR